MCRKFEISETTYYDWRKIYAGLTPSEMKLLRTVEKIARVKRLVADLSRNKEKLQDVISRML